VNVFYKHSRIKQYLKEGRALRVETVVNSPRDLGNLSRLEHLNELQDKARACNRRLVDAERVGQGFVLASPAFERVALPSVTADGRRAPALRFGDPRVMALVGALCIGLNAVVGFTNRSLSRPGDRPARHRIHHQPNELRPGSTTSQRNHRTTPRTNTWVLTKQGQSVAVFYTKVHDRLLHPLLAANAPPAPPELRDALPTIDQHVRNYATAARLTAA
jgi:hypothetical protein